MKGSLYLITNRRNNMKYVGKTYKSIEDRFKEHIKESKKARSNDRDLYVAMRMYGVENFEVILLGVYEQEELENKEIEYIKLYDTFANGYNQTLGGDGKRYITIPDEEFVRLYHELGTIKAVAEVTGHDTGWIGKILKANNVEVNRNNCSKIKIEDTNLSFNSLAECAKHLIETGMTTSTSVLQVSKCISRVLTGDRKTYLKMKFSYC